MTESTFWLYETFNYFEAAAWFVIALVLPFKVKGRTPIQRFSVFVASFTFVAFGITDLLEAPTHADLPIWLWIYKFLCATVLLSCRYTYLGWGSFRLNDRYLIFALVCLFASAIAVVLPRLLERILA
jgi:hypothetical protein